MADTRSLFSLGTSIHGQKCELTLSFKKKPFKYIPAFVYKRAYWVFCFPPRFFIGLNFINSMGKIRFTCSALLSVFLQFENLTSWNTFSPAVQSRQKPDRTRQRPCGWLAQNDALGTHWACVEVQGYTFPPKSSSANKELFSWGRRLQASVLDQCTLSFRSIK